MTARGLRTRPVWHSLHVHLVANDIAIADEAVVRIVAPVFAELSARRCIAESFFIRYWSTGPHLRLRFQGCPKSGLSEDVLRTEILRCALEKIAENPGLVAAPRKSILHGETTESPALLWVPYEPEVIRYGGTECLAICEAQFGASTQLTLEVFPGVHAKKFDRNAVGLAAMVVFLRALGVGLDEAAALGRYHQAIFSDAVGDEMARLDEAFSRGWSRSSQTVSEQVNEWWNGHLDEAELAPFARFHASCQTFARQLRELASDHLVTQDSSEPPLNIEQTIRIIAPSLMHMTGNRLGLTRIEEAFLGHLIWRAIADI